MAKTGVIGSIMEDFEAGAVAAVSGMEADRVHGWERHEQSLGSNQYPSVVVSMRGKTSLVEETPEGWKEVNHPIRIRGFHLTAALAQQLADAVEFQMESAGMPAKIALNVAGSVDSVMIVDAGFFIEREGFDPNASRTFMFEFDWDVVVRHQPNPDRTT